MTNMQLVKTSAMKRLFGMAVLCPNMKSILACARIVMASQSRLLLLKIKLSLKVVL